MTDCLPPMDFYTIATEQLQALLQQWLKTHYDWHRATFYSTLKQLNAIKNGLQDSTTQDRNTLEQLFQLIKELEFINKPASDE